ncbi:CHAP domain-containing protein [Kitasatospora sp. NPDC002040]|uniref:CHAP domain-containing protein n=1 Tax=Kitasatospora sp. NPDC002040 TaxID=3154661 RepID=UPI00332FFC53
MPTFVAKFTKPALATLVAATVVTGLGVGPARADTSTGNLVASIANANLGKGPCSANSTGHGGSPNAGTGFGTSCNVSTGQAREEWCADFAEWAWNQAGYTDTGDLTSAAWSFARHGATHGTFHWVTDTGYTPQPGDAIVWRGNGYQLSSFTDPGALGFYDVQHVSLVSSVSSRTSINDTGGNQGNAVTHNGPFNPTLQQGWGQQVIGYISPGSGTPAPTVPAGFSVHANATGAAVVNLTSTVTANGYINYLNYRITGPNGYSQQIGAGGGPTSPDLTGYTASWNTTGLATGTYTVTPVANEIDGADHSYAGSVVTVGARSIGSDVVLTPSGGLATYWVGSDGIVWGKSQAGAGGAWSAPQALTGTGFIGKVSAVVAANGTIALYVRTTNGAVFGGSQSGVGGAFGWNSLGGTSVTGDPTAVVTPNGSIALYATATDGNVWGMSQSGVGGPFSSWGQLTTGGGLTGKVSVVVAANGTIALYVRTTNGAVFGGSQSGVGGAFGWNSLGGTSVTGDPTAVVTPNGTIALYATATDGNVWGMSQSGVGGPFSSWGQLTTGGGLTGKVSVVVAANGTIALYVRTVNGAVFGGSQSGVGGAFGWNSLGGTNLSGDPTAIVIPNSAIALYDNSNGQIWGTNQNVVGGPFAPWALV